MQNLLELKPLIEYIKNPIQDNRLLYTQRQYYIQEIKHDNNQSSINIPSINFEDISTHNFIEELLIDFFFYDKAKPEDFKPYFKQDYLKKLEYIAKMYKGEEIKRDE